MILGIDASNIRGGGGVSHLIELLRTVDPASCGFNEVIVWSGQTILDRIEDQPWLTKSSQPMLDHSLPFRVYWQRFRLRGLAVEAGCDVLFVPGGLHIGGFHPVVTMSQNLLPFERRELLRYGLSLTTLRILALRCMQSHTFRGADGIIFLTKYAHDRVRRSIGAIAGKTTTVPHGIAERFICSPREQMALDEYTHDVPFRILYVSIVDLYKHQWHVSEAIGLLRRDGLPITLDLVGPAYPPALRRLTKMSRRIDPNGDFIRYLGEVPYGELHALYEQADMGLFASSCENMPIILVEVMASGLPIACSDRGPMPEILQDCGVYFDPEDVGSIASAVSSLLHAREIRETLAQRAFTRAGRYSWKRCANDTFAWLADVGARRQPRNDL